VTTHVVEQISLMLVEFVTVLVSQTVTAHVLDKLMMNVESVVDQVLLNHTATVKNNITIVMVIVVVLQVLMNVVSVVVLVSQKVNVTVKDILQIVQVSAKVLK